MARPPAERVNAPPRRELSPDRVKRPLPVLVRAPESPDSDPEKTVEASLPPAVRV
jgi:hypothetical protein